MGISYIQHSDMCGCERCAAQADCEEPRPVFDKVEDPDVRDCGCSVWDTCRCDMWD